jgi:hypothetical protein
MGENHPAQAPTASSAADEEANEPTVFVTAFLVLNAFAFVVVFPAFADHVGENHPAQPPTASCAADQDAREPIIIVAAFLFFDAFVFFVVRTPVAQEAGDKQAPHALAATKLAAGNQTGNVALASAATIEGRIICHKSSPRLFVDMPCRPGGCRLA